MRDDDALDLSAWETPPPPDGIADAVIARIGGTGVSPGMPVELPTRKRSIVIAASAAAALLVAAGVWAIVRTREHSPPAHGELVADRAQHVDLGGVSVDLDRGADIRWERSGERLHIDQKAGTAAWRVGDQHVEIAAATATIETHDANVRVEVPMNLSDARVIGASTVTAAAVAMVTVVVYEGHVQVHHGDQTVVVQPGSTYTVAPPAPPEPSVVGVAPAVIPSGAKRIAVLGLDGWKGDAVPRDLVEALRARVSAAPGPYVLAKDSAKELTDEMLLHDCSDDVFPCMLAIGRDLGADVLIYGSIYSNRGGYEVGINWLDVANKRLVSRVTELIPPARAQGVPLREEAAQLFDRLSGDSLPDAPDETVVQEILAGNADELDACQTNAATLVVAINGAGKASSVQTAGPGYFSAAPPCVSQVIGGLQFPRSKQGGTFSRPLVTATCDVDALVQEGNGYLSIRDMPEVALAKYEAAIACKPQPRLYKLAFTAACKVPSAAKARTHWLHLSAEDQRTLLPLCTAQGISRDALDGVVKPPCDADALQQTGEDYLGMGQYAAGLGTFEQGLACKPGDEKLTRLAFLAACKSKNVDKARWHYKQLPANDQATYAQLCVREGITQDQLRGSPAASAATGTALITCNPPARVLIDGKDTGKTTPVTVDLVAGKHKLTLQLGGDRFTYPLVIKAGETETISKDLQ